jgi:predicted MFS family arabinose efflux permease
MRESREVILFLTVLQALLLTNSVITMLLGGPIGAMLASDAALATIPITTFVVGTALTAFPASLLMKRAGRRTGFMLGCLFGIIGAAICAVAVLRMDFLLFCAGTFLNGCYSAFGNYYRIAAGEAVGSAERSRAIAYVLGGGIAGAFIGPWSATQTRDLFSTAYVGPYVVLMLTAVASLVVLFFLKIAPPRSQQQESTEPARPLVQIAAQPRFIAAVLGAVTGYAVMNFLMTATPLAMAHHNHGDANTAFVFQWHVIAMFAPSFFSGALIQRYGAVPVMSAGALVMVAAAATAHVGSSIPIFWIALVLLGIGWNFLYVGGTTMLLTAHRPSERGKVQGLNDTLVFAATGSSSLLSGVFLHYLGWEGMVLTTLPLIALTLIALAWARGGPQPQPAHLRTGIG